jgi:hypothetical protein
MTEPVTSTVGSALGVKLATAVFGFAGGVVSLAFIQNLSRKLAIVSVGVGLICAIALTSFVSVLIHLDPRAENGLSFLIGLTAMSSIPLAKSAIGRRITRLGGDPQNQPIQGEGDAK